MQKKSISFIINTTLHIVAFFLLFILISCSDDPDFLEGFDRELLFSQPTQEELLTVEEAWASRNLNPTTYTIEEEIPIGTGGTVLKMISFKLDGYKEYGALLIPDTDTLVPVRMALSGFTINPENTIATSLALSGGEEFRIPYIYAIPAFRGQDLHITLNGVSYSSPISEGNKCNAFDRATDDAIALLNIVENTEAQADMNKVSVQGGSRGGTVAMLMGERDDRVKKIIGIAAPTNMLDLTSKNQNDAIYICQFLQEFVNGTITIDEARQDMIASSPLFFAEKLPSTQLHLGENDRIVPPDQGAQLIQQIDALSLDIDFQLFVYENRNHSDIVSDNQILRDRIEAFLQGF